MKKLSLAAIIVTVSISLAGCTNSETASNGNKTNTESTTQNSTESNVQNSSESSTENNNVNNAQNNSVNNPQGNISLDKAKEIALSHAGLASNQVTFQRIELDFDNGIQKYEIEFYYNYREYSYEIDANTGNILSYEQD